MYSGLCCQSVRLTAADYPGNFVLSVMWNLIKKIKVGKASPEIRCIDRLAVFPYLHSVEHSLKKFENDHWVKVVFSAASKFEALAPLIAPEATKQPTTVFKKTVGRGTGPHLLIGLLVQYSRCSRTVIFLVVCAEKPTTPQYSWKTRAGVLRRSPPLATNYQHHGDN